MRLTRQDLYIEPYHFNVFLFGQGLETRRWAREITGRNPKNIERIWIVELKRGATELEDSNPILEIRVIWVVITLVNLMESAVRYGPTVWMQRKPNPAVQVV
jgi:hypothetical protein